MPTKKEVVEINAEVLHALKQLVAAIETPPVSEPPDMTFHDRSMAHVRHYCKYVLIAANNAIAAAEKINCTEIQ